MVIPDLGMKMRKNAMTAENTEIVRRHVEAVTQMLLGNRTLQPGAMIVAGELTDESGRMALAQMADALGKDLVFLAFGDTADGYGLTDVAIVALRNGVCHARLGCRFYLPRTGARAVILPKPNVRGHFRLAPGELMHVDRKPADSEDGVVRATARLAQLVERGVDLDGRAIINTYPVAA
jgi:hypothetical protein